MPITIDGSGSISGANSFTTPATFTGAVSLPSGTTLNGLTLNNGKIIQVSQVSASQVSTGSSTSFATLSITPSSSSNRIFVMCNAFVRSSASSGNNFASVSISRGATTIVNQYVIGNWIGSTDIRGMCAIAHLDSPATTSSVTYTASISALATTVWVDNALAGPSTFTLMEVVP